MQGRIGSVVGAALASLAISGCLGTDDGTTADPRADLRVDGEAEVSATRGEAVALELIGEFREPVFVAQPPGSDDLYVVEKEGRVVVVSPGGSVAEEPFLDLSREVASEGEQGLLSLAFAPDYEESGLAYVAYSSHDGELRVEEYRRLRGSPALADPGSRRTLLVLDHPSAIHWGGLVLFGPDDLLYLGTGEAGEETNAQDLESLLGKILRIDPRPGGGAPYTIPAGNPFVGSAGRDEIYAYGLRNPWRFSFDAETGDLAIGDVGERVEEEVSYVRRANAAGANFGWPVFEGNAHRLVGVELPEAVAPALAYGRDVGPDDDPVCSVTGGYVVRDPELPALEGRYVYGDFCRGRLRSFAPSPGRAGDDQPLGLTVDQLSSFSEDRERRIYATSLGGEVFRLVAP